MYKKIDDRQARGEERKGTTTAMKRLNPSEKACWRSESQSLQPYNYRFACQIDHESFDAWNGVQFVCMEQIILQILDTFRSGGTVDDRALLKLSHAAARRADEDKRMFAKRRLLPFYQDVKENDPKRWKSWNVTPELEEQLVSTLRMKPRRSASGVATITVITKPWPCGGDCLFCPNDIRMPKSYLHNEPACERAEQNWFDPYLQVASRLTALAQMGHATDKIELIVLGGTWSDYPQSYQVWFISELFRALNDCATVDAPAVEARRSLYRQLGFPQCSEEFSVFASREQEQLNAGACTYNQAFRALYLANDAWQSAGATQVASFEELERLQHENETAQHRVVGLVIETRPDAITPQSLAVIRRLGCTKVQMGVQTLSQDVLDANDRGISLARIQEAFELLRIFGFKIHAHAMANLFGATPEHDKCDFRRLVEDAPYQPDEIKLYPCALIEGAHLCGRFREGTWRPYTEDELLDVLVSDVAATPPFCRISRMIRDFSSKDILVGNKKPNLRQLVEERLREQGNTQGIQEIRFREVGLSDVDPTTLTLSIVSYETSNTSEQFLQWVTPENRIAGFLRLSLPFESYVERRGADLPIERGEAMIREVHVYGVATQLGEDGVSAQHLGLGKRLIEYACDIAYSAGFERINVISAVGTREYYRRQGFTDHGLYQQRRLS